MCLRFLPFVIFIFCDVQTDMVCSREMKQNKLQLNLTYTFLSASYKTVQLQTKGHGRNWQTTKWPPSIDTRYWDVHHNACLQSPTQYKDWLQAKYWLHYKTYPNWHETKQNLGSSVVGQIFHSNNGTDYHFSFGCNHHDDVKSILLSEKNFLSCQTARLRWISYKMLHQWSWNKNNVFECTAW